MHMRVRRLLQWIESRGGERPIVLIGVLLVLPAVLAGFTLDDHFLFVNVWPQEAYRHLANPPWSMFTFVDENPARTGWLLNSGVLPWFSDPELVMNFLRPLSSLTHWLDFRFWPEWHWLMHLHSIAWFALGAWLVCRLYVRLLEPRWLALLAGLLYAVDDAHAMPVGWLSNRNTLIAGVFGFASLLAYDRWRRDRWTPGAVWTPILLLLSVLSAEAGVATGAWLLSYALFLDRGTLARRMLRIAPSALVGVAWQLGYRALGYGAYHSGLYIDPGADPSAFFWATLERLPSLALGMFAFPPPEVFLSAPRSVQLVVALVGGLVLVVLLGVILRPAIRQLAVARFFAVGALLCLIPVSATFASDRLLTFAAFGGLGLIALLIGDWIEPTSAQTSLPNQGASSGDRPGRGAGRLAPVAVILHLGLAALLTPVRVFEMNLFSSYICSLARKLPDEPLLAQQTAVLVNPPFISFAGYFALFRTAEKRVVPARIRALSEGFADTRITREDKNTLVLEPEDGFYAHPMSWLMRDPRRKIPLHEPIVLDGLDVSVRSHTGDGRPLEVAFRFAEPLESSSLRFLRWDGAGIVPFELPPIGETTTLEGIQPPM